MAKSEEKDVFNKVEEEIKQVAKEEKASKKAPKKELLDPHGDLREKIISRLNTIGIEYSNDATTEELVALYNNTMESLQNSVKPTEVEDLLRQFNKEQGQRLIRITATNMDSSKGGLKGEFITLRNRSVGTLRKFLPYNTEAMVSGWHIPFAMYQHLLTKKFYPSNTKKDKFGMDIPVDREVPEYNITVLPPLTQAEIDEIATHQRANNTVQR